MMDAVTKAELMDLVAGTGLEIDIGKGLQTVAKVGASYGPAQPILEASDPPKARSGEIEVIAYTLPGAVPLLSSEMRAEALDTMKVIVENAKKKGITLTGEQLQELYTDVVSKKALDLQVEREMEGK